MKIQKIVALLLAMIVASLPFAVAEDLGIQLIGPDDREMETVSLDDMQLGMSYRIDGYAVVNPLLFEFYDCFAQYVKDMPGDNSTDYNWQGGSSLVYRGGGDYYLRNAYWNDSGANAEYAWLVLDITNLRKTDVKFMEEASVKVIYDDEYEYTGWTRQMNHDYRTKLYRRYYDGKYYIAVSGDKDSQLSDIVLDPANEESIGMMYTGTYVIGCTLPNAVVNSKAPLRIEIQLGSNELTYNIRK